MKAALYRDTGPAAEVLQVEEVERPQPGPGEVLVRVRASGVNPTDYKARAGMTPRPIDGFQVPHMDGAGIIEGVGAGVNPGRVGERVWLYLAAAGRRWGTAAEWTVVPQRQAVPLPDGASFDLGASLGVPAMTAHYCLFSDGPVTGQTVLVAGGAGAVGHFAIELAKRAGARVITTVSSSAKAALAEKAGADLVLNYRTTDVAERIRGFTPAVDRVIEVALGANLALDLGVSRVGSTIVTYAAEAVDPVLPVRACMTANVILRFMLLYRLPPAALDRAAADITAALAAGDLTGLPVRKFSLAGIAAAHEAAEAGVVGKIIVTPLLFREDPGVLGPAVKDLRADAVELALALAPAAAPVRVGEHGAVVPAAHVAPGALAEWVNAQRHQVADRDYDNNEYQHRRAPMTTAGGAQGGKITLSADSLTQSKSSWMGV